MEAEWTFGARTRRNVLEVRRTGMMRCFEAIEECIPCIIVPRRLCMQRITSQDPSKDAAGTCAVNTGPGCIA